MTATDLPDGARIAGWFTAPDGNYMCSRWVRPLAPVVFGADDATLAAIKGGVEAIVALAGHSIAETDPEMGANLYFFLFRDWDELAAVPDLDRLVDGLSAKIPGLKAEAARRYARFRFDADGSIRAAFVFLRADDALWAQAAEDMALSEAARIILTWQSAAFAERPPVDVTSDASGGAAVLREDVARVIRAAYDPVLPPAARDPSHALRLAARIAAAAGEGA